MCIETDCSRKKSNQQTQIDSCHMFIKLDTHSRTHRHINLIM